MLARREARTVQQRGWLRRVMDSERMQASLLVAPTILALGLTVLYPLTYSLWLSFHEWNYIDPTATKSFNYGRNYIDLFHQQGFVDALVRTTYFAVGTLILQFAIAIFLVVLLTIDVPGKRIIDFGRGLMLVPLILSPVVAGILWRTLFHPQFGPVNYFLSLLHLPQQNWLGTPNWSLLPVALVDTWQNMPVVFLILLGGLLSLPSDPFLAARVDGCTSWQIFRNVTLPLLKPFLIIALLIRLMDAFKVFDVIYAMTVGGPGTSSESVALLIFRMAIKYWRVTQAAAGSWILMIAILIMSLFLFRELRKEQAV